MPGLTEIAKQIWHRLRKYFMLHKLLQQNMYTLISLELIFSLNLLIHSLSLALAVALRDALKHALL